MGYKRLSKGLWGLYCVTFSFAEGESSLVFKNSYPDSSYQLLKKTVRVNGGENNKPCNHSPFPPTEEEAYVEKSQFSPSLL